MARAAVRRSRALVLGAVVVLTAGLIAPTLARADDPAGTVVLASGSSAYPLDGSLEAVTAGHLVFRGSAGQLTAVNASDGRIRVLADQAYLLSALGDRVLYADNDDRQTHWVNLSTGATGTANYWRALSADGGYYVGSVSGTTHLYDQAAATGAVTDLGRIAARELTGALTVLSNADGAAVIDRTNAVGYFVDATTHAVTTLSIRSIPQNDWSGLRCESISRNAVGCFSSSAGSAASVVRIPLDGSAGIVVATDVNNDLQVPHAYSNAYVTDTLTAWVTNAEATGATVLHTRRVADGTTAQRTIEGDLLTTPSDVYFRLGSAFPAAAIYSAADAGSTPTKVVNLPRGALTALGLALTPGRVSWRDDSTTAQPLYSRSLGSSSGNPTAGPRSMVATGATAPVLAVSGLRTAYVTGPDIRTDLGFSDRTVVVTDGTTSTQITHVDPTGRYGGPTSGITLSGSRVSYLHRVGDGTASHRVLDLRTQRTIDTTATLGAVPWCGVALWGNYYAFSKADGSLWRKDLSSSAPAVQVAPKWRSTNFQTNDVYLWGDWVTYTETREDLEFGTVTESSYRNMRTLSPARYVDDGSGFSVARVIGATAGGIVASGNHNPYELIAWGSTSKLALPASAVGDVAYPHSYRDPAPPAIDGSTVAWIGSDNLPRVAPLGHTVVNRPRALGAAIASSTLPVGGGWRMELPTSAALTSCQVTLANATGTTIRTLPCNSAAAAQGEAVADWDGRDGGGHVVAPGNYTWTVMAAGVDGSLLAADGSTGAVSGTVSVLTPALFHPVNPIRLLDTRTKLSGTRPGGRGTVVVQVAGRGGVPTTGVAAVALNVTVVHPASSGFVTAYADGTARPVASNLNFVAGQRVPNLVTVPVGANGRVDLYNGSSGATDLVADVAGYYASTPSGTPGAFVATSPTRLLDTRSTLGSPSVAASRGTVALDVAGHGPVPASGVSAVLLTVTATRSTASGYLTVYGGGTTRPTASNVNFPAGAMVPNLVVAPVGSDGRVNIYNGSTGATQIVADVAGYYLAGTPTQSGALVTTRAARLLDTRSSLGGKQAAPHGTVVLSVAGRGPVPTSGAGAVVLNVTAPRSTAPGYVTVLPHGATRPTASNLNLVEGRTVSNLADSRLGAGGQIDLYNGSTGRTDLIVDVFGYFLA